MGGRSPREPPVSPCSLTSDGRSSSPAVSKQPFSPVSLGTVADLSRATVLGNKRDVTEAACLDDARDLMLVSCDAMPSASGPDCMNEGHVSAGGHDGASAPSAATTAECDTSLLDACSRVAPGLSDVASEVMSAPAGAACVNFAQATSDVATLDAGSVPAASASDVCPPAPEPTRQAGPAPRRSARARVPSAIAASAAAAPVKRERRRKRCDAFPVDLDVAPVVKRPSPTDDAFAQAGGPSPLELSQSRASSAPRKPTLDRSGQSAGWSGPGTRQRLGDGVLRGRLWGWVAQAATRRSRDSRHVVSSTECDLQCKYQVVHTYSTSVFRSWAHP